MTDQEKQYQEEHPSSENAVPALSEEQLEHVQGGVRIVHVNGHAIEWPSFDTTSTWVSGPPHSSSQSSHPDSGSRDAYHGPASSGNSASSASSMESTASSRPPQNWVPGGSPNKRRRIF
jgi:hypothetical protein